MNRALLTALALLAGAIPARAQNVAIPALPQLTAPADVDLFLVEHVNGPPGQHTSRLLASDLVNYINNRLTLTAGINTSNGLIGTEAARAKAAEALLAPLLSPTLAGTPLAPTAIPGTNTGQIATTQFDTAAVSVEATRARAAETLLAPLASPGLTGTPTAPTAASGTSTTQLATTAFDAAAVAAEAALARNASSLSSGTVPPALLPTPTATTLGGVLAIAPAPNLFLTGVGTNGAPATAQPSFPNISGLLAASQMPALTGDVSTAAGSTATTLATSGVTAGAYVLPIVTFDAKGRATAASQGALTGDVTTTAGSLAATLAAINSNTGSFGSASTVPILTLDAKGRTTAAATVPVVAPAGTLSGSSLALGVTGSSLTSVGTLTGGSTGAGFTVSLGSSTISGTLPASAQPALTGDVTNTAGSTATTLAPSGATSGSYLMPSVTADAKGRITSITNGALTGDVTTAAGSLATTISDGVVGNTKLAPMAAGTVKGNAGAAAAAPADLTPAQAKGVLGFASSGANVDITGLSGLTTALPVSEGGTGGGTAPLARAGLRAAASGANSDITALSGLTTALPIAEGGSGATTAPAALSAFGGAPLTTTVTGSGPGGLTGGGALSGNPVLSIAAGGVANSMLAPVPAGTIKANTSAASAAPNDATPSAVLDAAFGATQGSVLYRGAAAWAAIGPGASGQFLQTQGTAANPLWAGVAGASGGTVSSVGSGPGLTGGPVTTTGTISLADNQVQGRLTLASATPVMTSAVNAATGAIWTPYHGNLVPLWNGTRFVETTCAEYAQTLADTTKSPSAAVGSNVYDEFAWNDAGTCRVTRGPAWSAGATAGSNVARGSGIGSTALTCSTTTGACTNTVAIFNGPAAGYGLFVGTIATDAGATVTFNPGSSAVGGSPATIGLWNAFNRRLIHGAVIDSTGTWTYGSATPRNLDASSGNSVTVVSGDASPLKGEFRSLTTVSGMYATYVLGLDGATGAAPGGKIAIANTGTNIESSSVFTGYLTGVHFLLAMEYAGGTGAAYTSYGAPYSGLFFDWEY